MQSFTTDRRALVLLLCGNVLFAAGLVVHAFLFNFYLRELELPATVMGHQVAAMTLGGLSALIPAGLIIDRWGTRVALFAGVGFTVVGLLLTALARTTGLILGAAFVTGAGAAACRVGWGPAIMRLTSDEHRARAFSWNVALLIGTSAAWTFAAGWVRDWSPLRDIVGSALTPTQATLIAGAAVTVLSAICYAGIPGTAATGRASGGKSQLALPRSGNLRLLVPLIALWMLAAALVLPFFNLFFADRYAMRVSEVGAVFASAQLVSALALIGAAELAARRGPRRMLFAWMALLAPALLALSLGLPFWIAAALFVVQGIVAPATNPLIDQLLLERAPRERHGIVASWRNAAAEASGAAGASTGGWILQTTSFTLLLQVAGVAAATSSLLLYGALRADRPAVTTTGSPERRMT
ncbi:MAG TPA: MFS transporter [Gemmatimonadaceae bacterium]|nr:MFS transporter [Gemmatimonadaceae bacterium]